MLLFKKSLTMIQSKNMERLFLKKVIFDAASKAAFEAIVKHFTIALKLHRCTQIETLGAVTEGNGFNGLGFNKVEFRFVYYGLKCWFKLSPNGGQFYAFVEDAREGMLMSNETCQTVDAFIRKINKKLKIK